MITTYLISETYIKENSTFNQNLDIKELLTPNIPVAQDMHIQPVLGSNYYDIILERYKNQTLTENEIKLVEHIKPVLLYRACELSVPMITMQMKNKGLMSQSGENSESANQSGMVYYRNELINRAEFYSKRLTEYLEDNKNLYPEYTTNNNDDMKPDNRPYDGGFSFYN